jgi:hypothetical protein
MYTFMKVFLRQIYLYNFYICKLNNLKVIDDLYSQCLTQTLSKTSSKSDTVGVHAPLHSSNLVFQKLLDARQSGQAPSCIPTDSIYTTRFLLPVSLQRW